ncbi:TPA: hypothetical protein HA344_08375 [Candidatus Bathyarchaeota archaeon]|nr:hypothetical protein [Candidatus Bathyarchaeota archaeon]
MGALDTLRLAWEIARIAVKAPGIYTGMYFARRRAVGAFRKQLLACGVDKATVKELSKDYPKIDDMVSTWG